MFTRPGFTPVSELLTQMDVQSISRLAVCRMLLTAIWNILSKPEPYSAAGYLEDKLTEHSVVISKAQGLELLRKRGYVFRDEVDPAPA